MRSIKFRAFIDGEMVYDLAYEEYAPINDLLKGTDNLMQFTGLLDRQGVEIYEGDIVKINEGYFSRLNMQIFFDDDSYSFRGILTKKHGNDCIDLFFGFDIEVIGNIYENKELLENKS